MYVLSAEEMSIYVNNMRVIWAYETCKHVV